MRKLLSLLSGVALVGSVGIAQAADFGGPVQLSALQLDSITAGHKKPHHRPAPPPSNTTNNNLNLAIAINTGCTVVINSACNSAAGAVAGGGTVTINQTAVNVVDIRNIVRKK
ncbi:hypothetical protein [Benzoatithermus flavus]|uniref:Uncharacterized protein n=1 Tax=Benzoatithermus flavus TaxID=3108223 RepID=A0ABU8XLS0_9PROT